MPDKDNPEQRCGAWREGLLIAIGCLLLFGVGIGLRTLWFPDEPDVGQPTIEMLARGDWVTPTQNQVPWIDYPPLMYWLGQAFSRIAGGASVAMLRLPSVLAGTLLVLLTWWCGRRWFGPGVGRWAALMMAVFPQYVWLSINVQVDILFAATQAGGILLYACGDEEQGRRRWMFWVAAFALFGLAWLAKGPLGLLLPGFVLTIWQLSRGQWRRWLMMAPLALVSVAVAAPWYIALVRVHGLDWVWEEVYAQNFARYSGGARGHTQPCWYHLVNLWPDIIPFGLVLPWALGLFGGIRRLWRDDRLRLAWLWFVICFIFFSVAVTKRQVYLALTYPAIALLLANWYESRRVAARGDESRPVGVERVLATLCAVTYTVMTLASIGVFFLSGRLAAQLEEAHRDLLPALSPAFLLLSGVCCILAVGAWRSAIGRSKVDWRWWPVSAAMCLWIVGQVLVFPVIDRVRTYEPAVAWMEERLPDDAPLALYGDRWVVLKRCGFLNHMDPARPMAELRSPEELAEYWRKWPLTPVFISKAERAALLKEDPGAGERIAAEWQFGSRHVYALRP